MRRVTVLLLLAAAFGLNGQALLCPTSSAASGRPCEVFHFHVQAYDPETRQFTTLVGINEYASQVACDVARDVRARQNTSVVDYVKRVKTQQYEADRIGPCHCDMSIISTSATYLTDAQRQVQKRAAEDVRRRVRAKLLDLDLPGDSELISGLSPVPASNAMLAGPRLTQLPSGPSTVPDHQASDLRLPRVAQSGTPSNAAIDLPLAEITAMTASQAAPPPPATKPVVTSSSIPATPPVSETTVPFDAAPSQPGEGEPARTITATISETPEPATTDPVVNEQASAHESSISAEDSADAFIRHETQRIQNVVNAITDPPDDTGEKVLEACTLRLQALSNLRSLILGSGARSRLAHVARTAGPDSERLQLVTRLFGPEISAHWMPKVTTDVLIAMTSVDSSPERVLRDSSGQFVESEKKRALYMLLSRSAITEEQQLWLIPVVEGFLQ